jgi:hypothetical protein
LFPEHEDNDFPVVIGPNNNRTRATTLLKVLKIPSIFHGHLQVQGKTTTGITGANVERRHIANTSYVSKKKRAIDLEKLKPYQ